MRVKTGKIFDCIVCGKPFYRPACHIRKDTKYCNRKCFYKGRPKQTNTGKTHFKKGMVPWNKGLKGVNGNSSTIFRKGNIPWNTGLGIAPLEMRLRWTDKYKNWRTKVFERDNYTCVWCGCSGGVLNADHIKSFALYPLFRFRLSNGRTLCVPCHKKTPTYGRFTKKQWEEAMVLQDGTINREA